MDFVHLSIADAVSRAKWLSGIDVEGIVDSIDGDSGDDHACGITTKEGY